MHFCPTCDWATVTCNNCGGRICKNCDTCSDTECSVEFPRSVFDVEMDLDLETDPAEIERYKKELAVSKDYEDREWRKARELQERNA